MFFLIKGMRAGAFLLTFFVVNALGTSLYATTIEESEAYVEQHCGEKIDLAVLLKMTPAKFSKNVCSQHYLFLAANEFKMKMIDLCRQSGGEGKCVVILKREHLEDFVKEILDKTERKHYSHIGQMSDIVRGRFNLDNFRQVEKTVELIEQYTKTNKWIRIIEVIYPRSPILDLHTHTYSNTVFGYPRFHVVMESEKGLDFEWQVGTKNSTEILETPGVPLPQGIKLPRDFHTDLHDIDYRVLRAFASKKANSTIVTKLKINEYLDEEAATLGEAAVQGNEYNTKAKLVSLHKKAGTILNSLIQEKGLPFVQRLFGEVEEDQCSIPSVGSEMND